MKKYVLNYNEEIMCGGESYISPPVLYTFKNDYNVN